MRKEKYVFNDKTLQFEKHTLATKQIVLRIFTQISAIFFTGALFYFGINRFLPSPEEKSLRNEINQLKYQVSSISNEYEQLANGLNQLHRKDNEVHRMVFGISPLDNGVWEGGTGGHDKYEYLNSYGNSSELVKSTLSKIDRIKYQIDLQGKSLDSLYNLAVKREKRLASVPSIKPVRVDKLKKDMEYLSGFGIRLHPVHKVKKLHKGIDFTAPAGTPIQATGDGTIVKVETKNRGYGNSVVIDHGFGYETLYGHMKTITVKAGQKVKKGQSIGTVGNTGTSTAPHCHYEVHINGNAVNPVDYVLDGLTPSEYKELAAKAGMENQSWD